nr:MAG TPA: hypothetical protein [Caudoviricetes sp.]DAT07928.1 MAG TPA: hypothetical protein [Caudoviricetes sp.]
MALRTSHDFHTVLLNKFFGREYLPKLIIVLLNQRAIRISH